MKRFVTLAATVWLMFGFAWGSDAAADEPCMMYVHVREGTYLNGRREPNLHSPILMTMGRGFAVEVLTIQNGWAQVKGGEAGAAWCCADYLGVFDPDEDAPLYTVVSNGRVRVRQSPEGKPLRYVRNGDTVTVRFVIGGWAYIGDGYVDGAYIVRSDADDI